MESKIKECTHIEEGGRIKWRRELDSDWKSIHYSKPGKERDGDRKKERKKERERRTEKIKKRKEKENHWNLFSSPSPEWREEIYNSFDWLQFQVLASCRQSKPRISGLTECNRGGTSRIRWVLAGTWCSYRSAGRPHWIPRLRQRAATPTTQVTRSVNQPTGVSTITATHPHTHTHTHTARRQTNRQTDKKKTKKQTKNRRKKVEFTLMKGWRVLMW